MARRSVTRLIIDSISLLLLGLLCYLVFFNHLGEYTARMWDEARNGVNAIEMMRNTNLLVTYFNGAPDLWNVKPPFFIWLVAFLFKLFGPSEFLLRLPSAVAATVTTFAIYFFGRNVLKRPVIGLLGSLILLSSMGFPDAHIGRTGDYDSLLTMWVFLASILFFLYTQTWKNRHLGFSVLFWTLAVFTKSIAGVFIIPALILFLIVTRNIRKVLKNPFLWKTIAVSIFFILAYYIGREIVNPLYLKSVLREEFGRYGTTLSLRNNDFLYYWKYFSEFRFQKWIFFVPFSILAIFITKDKTTKNWVLFSYLLSVSYFLIISFSKTKNIWYDAQSYPFFSLLVSLFIVQSIKLLPTLLRIVPILILCFYMQRYIRTNIAFIYRPDLEKSNSCIGYGYLSRDNSIDKNGFIGVHEKEDYCMPFRFYLEKDGLKSKRIEEVTTGDKIFSCDMPTLSTISKRFSIVELFNSKDGCKGYKVNERI